MRLSGGIIMACFFPRVIFSCLVTFALSAHALCAASERQNADAPSESAESAAAAHELYEAAMKGDADALSRLTGAAEAGSVMAMHSLSYMYGVGKGVEKNEPLAFAWDLKLAEAGQTWAMYQVGYEYQSGRGVAVNYFRAM